MENILSPLALIRRRNVVVLSAQIALVIALLGIPAEAAIQSCADGGASNSSVDCSSRMLQATRASQDVAPTTASRLPGADHATEASADGSLSSGATYNEGDPRSTSGAEHSRRPISRNDQPEPLTEFQRFVAASIGQVLPIYGAHLFTVHPERFAPVDRAAAPGEFVVAADDELRIRIWGQVNFSANLRVSREGDIYLPKVGAVHVAGLPFSALSTHLRAALDRVYRNYEFTADLGEIHSIQVYVTGHAHKPGAYTVSGLSTLLDAIFSSGGPSAAGSMRHVLLKRNGLTLTDLDLYALLIDGDKAGDLPLQSGDVIYFAPVGAQVALSGSVRQSGIYELRGEEELSQLLRASGGTTSIAHGGRLSFERIDDQNQRRAFEVAFDADGLATRLRDGDMIRVESIASHYHETVTLRGSIASPGRFRWHAEMHLSELMPDRESLMSRDYWWHRTQLGLPSPEFMPSIDGLISSGTRRDGSGMVPQSILQQESAALTAPDTGSHASSERTAQAGQSSSVAAASPQTQSDHPASILRPKAQTNWHYAVIERLDPATMTSSLIPFDLGELVLNHNPTQDLELRPNDVVTVFSEDDIRLPMQNQTKYVRLEGEFVYAGIYSVRPGETLRALAMRAGGLTSSAYLFGSEFTRNSTRELEQQRMNEYAARIEQQVQQQPSGATSGVMGAQDARQAEEAANTRRDLIARLRTMRAAGRIVLELPPQSAGAASLPDIPLEDGDRLIVPSTPATVQVSGAVMNQNAFLHRKDATVSEYLSLAGGPSRDADRRRPFILRADGSITPRNCEHFMCPAFGHMRLNPGDTVVVPMKLWHPSNLNEIMAWVQMFSSLSLSAAAISVIR